MRNVLIFGGSSLADARQFAKVKSIVEADPARRVVIVSAPGKRFSGDHKITDLLYLCAAHIKYGVSCEDIFAMIRDRYNEIIAECGLHISLDKEFDALWDKMKNGISQDELASRGEYFSARLMAEYLGYEFVDAARWIKFKFDGTVDQDASYEALRSLAEDRRVVIPGFYGVMPDGHIRTFSRGGSDITGALAAAALGADVYENWTDVSGILMADPRIVDDPEPIRRVTYSELRELSYIGAQVLHEGTIFPVREKNIPLNIRNTNAPDHPGTMIMESIGDEMDEGGFITGIAGKKGFSIITIAKKSVANFKLREGMPVGAKVTLRGDKMWEFLDRLFNVALPRVRDFRGISANAFDGRGNYALGIKEQLIFPEIEYDKIDKIRGMDVVICTTAQTDEEARELLTLVGAPFER